MAKISLDRVREKISLAHGDNVVLDESTYIKTMVKCRFIDIDYGEFWMTPSHVFNGSGHRERALARNGKRSRLPIEEVKSRLFGVHGDTITIKDDTYRGMYRYASFFHEVYGEWQAYPNNVIEKRSSHPDGAYERSIATFNKNYGADNPMHNKDVFKRNCASRWKKVNLIHWKTGAEVICTSSYEYAVVSHLNKCKIDYEWQIKKILTNGMTYFTDLYLKDLNRFVEIKGIFWSDKNKLKWDLFHSEIESSEIWHIKEVSNFVGKTEYRIKKDFKEAWSKKINLKET